MKADYLSDPGTPGATGGGGTNIRNLPKQEGHKPNTTGIMGTGTAKSAKAVGTMGSGIAGAASCKGVMGKY